MWRVPTDETYEGTVMSDVHNRYEIGRQRPLREANEVWCRGRWPEQRPLRRVPNRLSAIHRRGDGHDTKGAPNADSASVVAAVRTRTLARGVASIIRSGALLIRWETSQPDTISWGGGASIGLRATGANSGTQALTFWVEVRMVFHNGGRYAASIGQQDSHGRIGGGQCWSHETETNRAAEGR